MAEFKVLSSGNIEMTVVLMPDAYAALMMVKERDNLTPVNVVNLALLGLNEMTKTMESAGSPLNKAMAEHEADA